MDSAAFFLHPHSPYTAPAVDALNTTHVMDSPILRPWWRKPRWIQAAIAVAALVLIAVAAAMFLGNAERSLRIEAEKITIAEVTRGAFHDFIPLRASVVALDTIYLDALEGGRVERVLAQPGDLVTAGQPLVELSNTQLELDVLDREGRLIESLTQLQTYETNLEQIRITNQKALAQIEYDIVRLERILNRRKQLASRGLESVESREALEDELAHQKKLQPMQDETNRKQEELRVRQLPQIHAQMEKLQRDLQITHGKLANLRVVAPAAGRLTSMELKVGENRNRGERFAEITAETGYKLTAAVDEYYLGRVRNGQTADVDADGKRWQLTVTRIYPQVKNGTFNVDLLFAGAAPDGLLPGRALQGKLSLGEDREAVLLPAGAFLEQTGGDWIFVLNGNGDSAQRRTIKVGRRNTEQVEVLANLAPGDRVIVSDYSTFERIERIDITN
jgi:HlyD family secretion protein